MNDVKFLGAYCKSLDKYITLKELRQYEKSNKNYFKDKIQYNLYCPECKGVLLSYVSGSEKYLRTFPKRSHAPECSLSQNNVDNTTFRKYIEEGNNEELNFKLNKFADDIFSNLDKPKIINPIPFDDEVENNSENGNSMVKRKQNQRYIPRQKISDGILFTNEDIYKFFYGTVSLKWYNNKKETKQNREMLLVFKPKDKRISICSIIMSSLTANYIKRQIPDCNNYYNANIVFLSKLNSKTNNNGRVFNNFFITHSSHMIIRFD